MTKADYIARVMLIMNEAGMIDKEGHSYIGAETAQIDRYIEGSYVDAWRRCASVMPRTWMGNKVLPTDGEKLVFDKITGVGYVVLPDDFYLLSKFKLQGWIKAVYEASIDNERVANIQSNPYTRGSTMRPVCVIDNKQVDGVVRPVMMFYSLPRGIINRPSVEEAIYIPMCKPLKEMQDDEEVGLDERIIEPMAYLSASTVFTLFEKYDIAKGLEQRVVEMFPALKTQKGKNVTYKQ